MRVGYAALLFFVAVVFLVVRLGLFGNTVVFCVLGAILFFAFFVRPKVSKPPNKVTLFPLIPI